MHDALPNREGRSRTPTMCYAEFQGNPCHVMPGLSRLIHQQNGFTSMCHGPSRARHLPEGRRSCRNRTDRSAGSAAISASVNGNRIICPFEKSRVRSPKCGESGSSDCEYVTMPRASTAPSALHPTIWM